MGDVILRFETKDGPRYLLYGSIMDAPNTFGMTLDEFKGFYQEEYGRRSLDEMEDRLKRADAKGSSGHNDDSLENAILCNRAGRGETRMTVEQMRDWYCCPVSERAKRKQAEKPIGAWPHDDDEDDEVPPQPTAQRLIASKPVSTKRKP